MKKLHGLLWFPRGIISKIFFKPISVPIVLFMLGIFSVAESYAGIIPGRGSADLQLSGESLSREISYSAVQQQNVVKGKVTDEEGLPLPGVTITIVGTTRGVITDNDGSYSIEANPTDKLVFSFVGLESQIIDVGNQRTIDVVLKEKIDELEEVTVVAFGKQKKESVISSIETIKSDELRVPSSNLTQAFSGRMAGVISYQTSGEPGQDDAQFFIRGITSFGTGKVDPLILIDNVEVSKHDLSRLHPDDIASFSILKDATATALYGARGANGVVMISTKEGKEGATKITVRLENSFSAPTQKIEMSDPITYMQLANEAYLTRDPLASIPYPYSKIDNTLRNTNETVYPTVDWMDMLTKDVTMNQRVNLNISGGGQIARYYIAGSLSQDNGILKVDKRNDFNSNIDLKKYAVRSNININIFKSTEAVIRVHGTFDDYTGPIPGGTSLYRSTLNVSPVRFPAYYETPETGVYSPHHILFGNFEGDQYYNPYAEMVRGYRQESKAVIMAQLELNQDLNMVTEGLTGRLMGNTIRNSAFDVSRQYNPFYYQLYGYNRLTGEYFLEQLNPETGTEFLNYVPGYKEVNSSFYGEGQLLYNRTFDRHGISGMLVGIIRNSITGNASTLSASLPQRNLGLSGRFTYDYDLKYFAEFNFGYNGSEKFDKSHRWGFFPSIGVGWLISKEPFWQGRISDLVSNFKVRISHGLVGNDAIGDERFFYLSDVQLREGEAFRTGYNMDYIKNGVVINSYSNPNIGWEIAKMTNLGIELGLFDGKLDVNADIYKQNRTNILQPRADIPISMGLWATPLVNVGKAESQGIDLAIDYNHVINNDLWITGRGNFTYATTSFKYYEEADFSEIAPWKSRIGNPISQQWGFVAERLFIDDADIANSARQDFGEYLPGDLKYKDINNDMVINELDMVPIGYPTTPVLNYGFGFSTGYKNFDMSFFLQGSGKSSFWIDPSALSPFRRYTSGGKYYETGLAKFIAEDYWSETTQNPDANWPRLSSTLISNNLQRSTYYMYDGNFLRLKSVELGYNLPTNISNTLKLKSCRFYISGTNLLLFSDFKLWDVEMGSNGLGYPLQRVFNLGVNVSL